jgi:nitrite reductase/ring-hydroxylating ferredoxin subunit
MARGSICSSGGLRYNDLMESEFEVISVEEFESKNRNHVFKPGNKQILITGFEDKIFAIDNRCPHEGYPLSQGSVNEKSCVLTCNWHNWKFDLKTGECFVGGDNVRAYPTKIENGTIIVDLSPPSPEEITKEITKGLKIAFEYKDYGRIARELARYSFNDLDPVIGLRKSILWSFDKFEWGATHCYAAAAEWLKKFHEFSDREDKLICLTEAIDHIAFDSLRHKTYAYTDESLDWDEKKFLVAVENEDEKMAVGVLNGGLKAGMRFKDFQEGLAKSSLSHYANFGHSLIYVYKFSELAELFNDPEIDRALILCLTRSFVYSSREDLIPEFKNYKESLEKLKAMKTGSPTQYGPASLDGKKINASYDWLLEHYEVHSIKELYDALLYANAKNFLHYDMKFQEATHNPVSQNVGWLSFTHGITFANAVRVICEKYPELWPNGLLQMASFCGRNTAFITEEINFEDWNIEDSKKFHNDVDQILLDHGNPMPIYSAHYLKTAVATFEEAELADKETAAMLLAALNRFLKSPIKGKAARRMVHQGINLVSKDF